MFTVFTTVPNNFFESVSQGGLDVVINRELSSVHNTHIHTVLNGMIEENRVEGLTEIIKSAEGEGQI